MKILKLVTQPSPKITSYQMKFAVNQALVNMTPTDEQIGECLRKVLQYNTLSGRFENRAHIELAKMGLDRVEVTDQGLNFIGKQTDRWEGVCIRNWKRLLFEILFTGLKRMLLRLDWRW